MSTFADRNSPMVMAAQRRIRAEQEAAEPPATIAARVGRLIEAYLSPPHLGGSVTEDAALDRWRAKLAEDAAELWGDACGREPEAVRLIELIQYQLGFVPGTARVIRSSEEIREKYRLEMPRTFR